VVVGISGNQEGGPYGMVLGGFQDGDGPIGILFFGDGQGHLLVHHIHVALHVRVFHLLAEDALDVCGAVGAADAGKLD
jgi:hypothetical protein